MSTVNFIGRGLLATFVAVLLLTGTVVGQADAREPWWHVNTISAPPSATGDTDVLIVEASNLGDAVANGFESPVTVTDTLPAGVTPTSAHAEGGGGNLAMFLMKFFSSCSTSGQVVSCKLSMPLQPYERAMIAIDVEVASGAGTGLNEVSVSGGGGPSAEFKRPLAFDGTRSYRLQSYEMTPEEEGGALNTQAGSHPFQLTTTLVLNAQAVPVFSANVGEVLPEVQPVALTKDLRFNLPAGLVGNPTPLPKCSTRTFAEMAQQEMTVGRPHTAKCPDDTVVGVSTYVITKITLASGTNYVPYAKSSPLFSLEPAIGEPARFGFITTGGPVLLETSVRTGGDYGVVVTAPDITELVGFIGSQVTFWGVPSNERHDTTRGLSCLDTTLYFFTKEESHCELKEKGQPFLVMPTSCSGPLRTTVEGDPWSSPGSFTAPTEYSFQDGTGAPIGQDGCNRLNFEPSIKVAPDGQEAATPTGLTVDVHVPQDASLNPSGLAESTVRSTTVTLPAGVALNPAGADGLQACGLTQVGLESPAEQACPEAAKVGTVEIHTPLLPHPLVGAAYLAQQDANPFGSLIALYIVVKDPFSGVIVKLAGQVTPDPVTGQLVSTFRDTPELPFEDLALHFFGGSRAPLGTPAYCGSYTTTASIAPWAGNPPVDSSSMFEITSGPNHAACSNPLPFEPELTTGSLNIQAGAFTPFTMTMSREDGNQSLRAIQLRMPPGLLGEISKVRLCGEADANNGTCGPESLIGETIVSVGLGGDPYTVRGGKVYITGPYAGSPYGLSIVNPAKAGPFDLGNVVVRAKIEVDPTKAFIIITTDTSGPHSIPQIIDGIPLQIKHVNVIVNRPEFTFNPTNCEPQQITGSLTSSEGATSALAVPFQVTNCAVLGFKPIFQVQTSGKTSRKEGASLHVRLAYPKAPFGSQANIGYVKVDLPKQLPSRFETFKLACIDTVFDQNPAACPAGSHIGYATATTPVLPIHLSGPAYFVSHGGAKFPELVVALSGEGITVYLHGETYISKGVTSSTFRTIPDVPIGVFELTLPQGPYSALAAPAPLCGKSLHMPTAFHAANGMRISQSTPIFVTGCPKHRAKSSRKHHKKHRHKKKQ